MNVAIAERTVEVMPLGRRGRYSLTPRLQEVYRAIVRLTDAANGVSPSQDELAREIGSFGGGYLTEALTALCERGWISLERHKPRGITLLNPVLRHLKPATDPRR